MSFTHCSAKQLIYIVYFGKRNVYFLIAILLLSRRHNFEAIYYTCTQ